MATGVIVGLLIDKVTNSVEDAMSYFPEEPQGRPGNIELADMPESGEPIFEKPNLEDLVDYTKYSKEYRNGHAVDAKWDEVQEDSDIFEIIDKDEFVKGMGNEDGYVTVTGTYFVPDDVLAGWNSELEPKNVSETVGERAISTMRDDPAVGAVYVRNHRLKVLYEIVRCDSPMEEDAHPEE